MESEGQVHASGRMPSVGRLGVGRIWSEAAAVLEDSANYDWFLVKAAWIREWSEDPKSMTAARPVYVEKSPPDLLRVEMLEREFPPASFLVMVRNPYAVAEGIRRHRGYDIDRCTRHWMYCSRRQIENIERLERRAWFTYEDLCTDPDAVRDKIVGLVPELQDLSFHGTLEAQAARDLPAAQLETDLNARAIDALDPEDVWRISQLLSQEPELCEFFGYRITT
jgi:hypothetical protein